jgi:cyclophilin family peptidyl-prolyl cis-trans isomerase
MIPEHLKFKNRLLTIITNIVLKIKRSNAPLGVDRFYELLTLTGGSYYNNNGFFRVIPGFVVQFGIR